MALVFGGMYNRVAALALALAHIPPLLLPLPLARCDRSGKSEQRRDKRARHERRVERRRRVWRES